MAQIILICATAACDRPPVASDTVGGSSPGILLELSVLEDGTATPLWARGTAIAIGSDIANRLARENRPLTPDADAWFRILTEAQPRVAERAGELATLFDVPPLDATIVVGNRASSDGFGWVPNYIGINVQAFVDTYGPPSEGATDRMVRIAAHEYLHLLTYAYYRNHRELRQTPFDRALWTIFFEGIGDYVSVSNRWLPDADGNYSPVAGDTLRKLEPVFVDRLERLVSASGALEKELRSGISMGRFDEKWGSLSFALWLHNEVKRCGENATLSAVIRLERNSVLALAERHAAPEFGSRIVALRGRPETNSDHTSERTSTCLAFRIAGRGGQRTTAGVTTPVVAAGQQ